MHGSLVIKSLLFTCVLAESLTAQVENSGYDKSFWQNELNRYKASFFSDANSVTADERFDVTYYKLNLRITTSPQYLRGSVMIKAISRVNGLATMTLDLMSSMIIDSVKIGSAAAGVVQNPSSFDVTLNRSYNSGEIITLEIFYQGTPGSSGFGSFAFSSHSTVPWVWSLSEPYGAKDWWPCKDHPTDKADSVDLSVTCDSIYKVGTYQRPAAVL